MNKIDYIKNPHKLIQAIRENVTDFKEAKIFIIGSLARKDFLANSDVDILVVTDSRQEVNQLKEILDDILVNKGIYYDLIHMTNHEFFKRKESSLIQEALTRGIQL